MSKWKLTMLIAVLLVSLLLTSQALAMASPNYRVDWFTPLTGGGGGPASSAHYAVNFTVGQSVIGITASLHFGSGMGYWYGLMTSFIRNYLPLVRKN